MSTGELPQDIRARLPEALRATPVEAYARLQRSLLREWGGETLLLASSGRLLVFTRESLLESFQPVALAASNAVRFDAQTFEASLVVMTATHGERSIWVSPALDGDHIRDVLNAAPAPTAAPLAPATSAPVADTATRNELLQTLSAPYSILVALLEWRANQLPPNYRGTNAMALDIERIKQELSGATVQELVTLVAHLRESWGLEIYGFGSQSAAPEAEASYAVVIEDCGPNKISAIRVVREVSMMGLKDAKDTVEQNGVAWQGVGRAQAEKIVRQLVEVGARARIQPAS